MAGSTDGVDSLLGEDLSASVGNLGLLDTHVSEAEDKVLLDEDETMETSMDRSKSPVGLDDQSNLVDTSNDGMPADEVEDVLGKGVNLSDSDSDAVSSTKIHPGP